MFLFGIIFFSTQFRDSSSQVNLSIHRDSKHYFADILNFHLQNFCIYTKLGSNYTHRLAYLLFTITEILCMAIKPI